MGARKTDAARVQELVQIAQETKGWGARVGTKRVYFSAPGGTTFDTHLEPTEHFLQQFEANLAKAGLPMELPKGQAHPDKTPHRSRAMIQRFASMTEWERAKTVWSAAVKYAVRTKAAKVTVEGREFYKITDKPLSYFINAEFGPLPYQGNKQQTSKPIYGYLRTSTNCIHVTGRNGTVLDDEAPNGYWLITVEWHEEPVTKILFRSPREPDKLDRRAERLTAHEAGEDREPGPVTVTQMVKETQATTPPVLASSEGERKPGQPVEGSTSEYAQYAVEGGFKCPECQDVFRTTAGLGTHRRTRHGVLGKAAKPKEEPQVEPRHPEPQAPVEEAMVEVDAALDLVRAEVERILANGASASEINTLRADVEHQRKRAEAAEGILRTIRAAIENKPMAQVFSVVAEVVPHYED